MTLDEFERALQEGTKIKMVFDVLRDQRWHCRECEYKHTGITQIAGGSGIQGLQRGTGSRAGLLIDSANHHCSVCDRMTRQDRWQGGFESAVLGHSMPPSFVRRAVRVLGSRDVIEGVERAVGQVTVDHKLPMLRWDPDDNEAQTAYADMSDDNIRQRFQLLKKSNGSVSHNLLKSRACERCWRDGRRAQPFGIRFFYEGGPKWKPRNKRDPKGCIGCGWYDFDAWRKALNEELGKGA